MTPEEALEWINRRAAGTLIGALGIRVVSVGDGRAAGVMPFGERVQQVTGLFHAGAILSLADSVATSAAMSVVNPDLDFDKGPFPLAVQTSSNLVGNASGGELRAEAEAVHRGRTMIVVETRVVSGEGKAVAFVSTTLLVGGAPQPRP
jgi:1,4-dihydroxy-2-naphthoyl-CoA hydrolase